MIGGGYAHGQIMGAIKADQAMHAEFRKEVKEDLKEIKHDVTALKVADARHGNTPTLRLATLSGMGGGE